MKPLDFGFDLYPEFRQCQLDALAWAQQTDKQVLMMEAPPGVGKSLIGAVWGLQQPGKGYVLTRTLSLLKQYENQLGLPGVRGASNFICDVASDMLNHPTTCEDGGDLGCHRRGFEDDRDCPYSIQRRKGLEADLAVTSYAYILADNEARGSSSFLVCDEGHSLLDTLTEYQTAYVPLELNPPHLLAELPTWALYQKANLPKIKAEDDPESFRKQKKLRHQLDKVSQIRPDDLYVLAEGAKSLILRPVWPPGERLWRERNLVMSATLSGGAFLADLFKLAAGNWDYTFVKSPFEAARRPFYIQPTANLSRKAGDEDYYLMAMGIKKLMMQHVAWRGLLHVSSYKQIARLKPHLKGMPVLFHEGQQKEERAALFEKFRNSDGPLGKAWWLMTPSAREGEDFPFDAARVNVIVKIPYPDLGDPVIAARREDGKLGRAYYAASTCANIAQAYGRAMRAEEDWGLTYVLDINIFNVLKYSKGFLPEYLLEAVQRL